MKSKIKVLIKNEQQAYLIFKKDENIIKNIEKTFQKLKPGFKLSNYKKKNGEKTLDNFWELQKKDEDFNFSLVIRRNIVKLKIKGNLKLIKKFLKNLEKYTEFAELSPKIKKSVEKIKSN